MTDAKKDVQVGNSKNSVMAAVAGALVAGVAVAGAMVMANKDNQDKVKEAVLNTKDKVDDQKAIAIDKAVKLKNIAKKAVNDVKKI